MPGLIQSKTYFAGVAPEGGRYLTTTLPFSGLTSATNGLWSVAISVSMNDSGVSMLQSIEIDNSRNGNAVYIKVVDSGQLIKVRANHIVRTQLFTGSLVFNATAFIAQQLGQNLSDIPIKLFNNRVEPCDFEFVDFSVGQPAFPGAAIWSNQPVTTILSVPAATWTRIANPNYFRRGFTMISSAAFATTAELLIGFGNAADILVPLTGAASVLGPGATIYSRNLDRDDTSAPWTSSIWAFQTDTVARNVALNEFIW